MKEYVKTAWQDHIVERPRTFELKQNDDKTVTLIKKEGEIIQQGTPISAKNLNKIEIQIEDLTNEINNILAFNTTLASEVAILKNASINNLNNNIFFEDFKDLNSINLKSGCYDAVNKRLVI